jgi:hypothetical protein
MPSVRHTLVCRGVTKLFGVRRLDAALVSGGLTPLGVDEQDPLVMRVW